ncbi:hypothetical protein JG687_00007693 [Phytophthora cactorum]|uniref:NADPH-dependent diflavin oxidoreductase 1 n=1 Tax=Phytophthora cactorum TaxID=29920 RepID=A0A8T1UJN6_9STRA|nr:hypothetical protein JG687_00007693 [Phytophthora cactorum]
MPRLLVLYGSETGTAQDVAEFVQQRAFNRQLLDTQISAMDEFPAAQLLPQCSTVVFVVSTTGDGEAPENMRNSWRSLLRKTLGSQWLEGVRVAVFGLGDSSYAKYNAVARRLQARLLQLGASELIDRGLGDDQHAYGYFGALNPWMEKLWTAVLQLHPLPDGVTIDDSPKPIDPRYSVIVHGAGAKEVQEAKLLTPRTDDSRFYAPPHTTVGREKGIYLAPVVVNKRITAEDWEQDVRHLEFDVSEDSNATEPPFRAGDIAVVYPENVTGVDDMLKYVKLDGDTVISINTADGSKQFDLPSPTTVRDLFTKHLAILEIPRRSFFERLSLFAVNEEEKEKLEELASAEGVDLLYDYCIREKKTYAEVLTDFPSVDVPLTILLQLIPRQKPRSYSISSSALLHPGRVHLTVAIVDFLTPYKRRRSGICSSFFQSLGPSNEQKRVPMWIKKGLFEPPSLDRDDFLYGDELRGLVTSGDLTELHTAFSRDQDHKIYVQTRLAENKEAIFDFIINGEGCIYIAGSAKQMPTDVYEVLRDILRSVGKIPLPTAEKVMKTLARKKRYVVESCSTNLSGMDVLEQAQHVRTFVKLANLTQTSQLHEWNLESLQRALEWACAAEDAVGGGESQQDVEMRIRRWFPVATLPTLPLDKALTADALRLARIHLLRSILQSPFLASHPTRSELLVAVLQELQSRREDSSSDEVEEHSPNR